MEEVWKDIEGYEDLYMISNYGNVKSLRNEKLLKIQTYKTGYKYIQLCKNGAKKKYKTYRLVAEAFIENPNNYTEINHKDENKANNRVDNLEWCTHEYNNNYGTRNERTSESLKCRYAIIKHHNCGRHLSEEIKEKISESNKGKVMSKESRKKISEARKGKYTREKSSQARKVICITTGETFNCMVEASEKYNLGYTNISDCCRGKHHTAGKHPITKERLVWRYYNGETMEERR